MIPNYYIDVEGQVIRSTMVHAIQTPWSFWQTRYAWLEIWFCQYTKGAQGSAEVDTLTISGAEHAIREMLEQ